MPDADFARVIGKLDRLDHALFDDSSLNAIAKRVAEQGIGDADAAVVADLGGDRAFTTGRTWANNPISFETKKAGTGQVEIVPRRKRGRGGSAGGALRVAESGRNQGTSALQGPGIGKNGTTARTKSGNVRKVRAFKAKRWNGTTQGFGTWTAGEREIEKNTPARVQVEVSAEIFRAMRG